MTFKAYKLAKRPTGKFTDDCFQAIELETPKLEKGDFLVKQTHMSLDPAMRTWVQDNEDSYIEPVRPGDIMRSYGVGEVVESENPDYPVGARVVGITGWAEYTLGGEDMQVVDKSVDVQALLSVLYVPGFTAYVGLMKIGRPVKGETMVVSGAAGSVGSLVGQMGKAEGLRVIGVAGSDEKCRWLEEELGFDKALNYKDADLEEQLAAATPDGIDLYFENTGGPIQHMVFNRMNRLGKIVVCGNIAEYTNEVPNPGPSWVDINLKALRVEGFVITDHYDKVDESMGAMMNYLQNGQIKFRSHVLQGLDSAVEGVQLLFSGQNQGKLFVEL
ncbi:NADP-dependent oxidoreductase [Marinobacter sp. M216]|uniref:NADP-dependent oxidoreductase n=1 Tax=Marinobacter albus TaxID=3030833 RepID=A0ABT7HFE1_9GAMM|nr:MULTISPECIES: NADP-dependent oxidoreductase [unclassified Marinobacter]MBW7472154.1 NADP-dependent oxidoreductase [Marinobacter sp. F4218]MDK9558724.1 NADP-dependent oxidoreductase [Marinobacter sp. M216]